MNRRIILTLAFAWLGVPALADDLVTLHSEAQAITYCNGGGVVWLDLASGQYVYKGSKFYGKGKNAAYVCEVQAIKAGGMPARKQ